MKLYWVHHSNYPKDAWLTVAENLEDLCHKVGVQQGNRIGMDQFKYLYDWMEIDVVDGYKILLQKDDKDYKE